MANSPKHIQVREIREKMGLTQRDFAEIIGLGDSGERTVGGWERDEHAPSPAKWKIITNLKPEAPFRNTRYANAFNFIDLFAGIGGIRYPFQQAGGKCVFTSEWDKFAKRTYACNYGEVPHGDITTIDTSEIPEHDILLAGFPCQTFSQAGQKKGFTDTRGTMFFEIQRILAQKRPKAFLLENVKQLKGHSKGETLKTILAILRGEFTGKVPKGVPMSHAAKEAMNATLDYWVDFKVLRAGDFGVPQNRERLIIVGFRKDAEWDQVNYSKQFSWPKPPHSPTSVGKILEKDKDVDEKYTISEKLWAGHQRRKLEHKEKGNGFGYSLFNRDSQYTNTISARYYKDGSEALIDQSHLGKRPRKLTPKECARLQGFPPKFRVDGVSDVQIYKQFGNSVAVPVIEAVSHQMIKTMLNIGMLTDEHITLDPQNQMKLSIAS